MSSDPKPGTTPGAVGAQLGTAVRVLTDTGSQHRLIRGVIVGGKHFFGTLQHTARLLWLQITGFVFLSFGVIGSGALVREYRAYAAGKVGPGKVALALCFTLMFLYFGVNSFWRTRKRQQSS